MRVILSKREIPPHLLRFFRPRRIFKPKDDLMIPHRVYDALMADGWYGRAEITWCKKSPMPESVTDRPTSATEKIFLLTKSARYFYDAVAVAEPSVSDHGSGNGYKRDEQISRGGPGQGAPWQPQATRNMRNFWLLGPEPFPDAHFATFVTEIPERCMKAGTSEKGACAACGAPWVRVVEKIRAPRGDAFGVKADMNGHDHGQAGSPYVAVVESSTTGWAASCLCEPEVVVPCVVLDPFAGAGTVSLVAERLGRDSIGVELNPEYVRMAEARIRRDCPMFAAVGVV
jgi:hypothetical protein